MTFPDCSCSAKTCPGSKVGCLVHGASDSLAGGSGLLGSLPGGGLVGRCGQALNAAAVTAQAKRRTKTWRANTSSMIVRPTQNTRNTYNFPARESPRAKLISREN